MNITRTTGRNSVGPFGLPTHEFHEVVSDDHARVPNGRPLWRVRHVDTGEILEREPVDARELIATGEYEHAPDAAL